MDIVLSAPEARVLGCLLEKQVTTPEYYPLTLHALVAACNQKSNRDPVVEYDDKTVLRALDLLREKKLSILHYVAGGRVPKYEHRLDGMFDFTEEQRGILCVLLLRGAQTAGELKGRTGRLCSFSSPGEVEKALGTLLGHESGPFVMQLPVQPGSREPRYVHLFEGTPDPALFVVQPMPRESARQDLEAEESRFAAMEAAIEEVRQELAAVRAEFAAFRKQFE